MKKAFSILANSIISTIGIMAILILTHRFFLDHIELLIMKAKGTSGYEGEERGTQIWNIIFGIISPFVFLIMICLFSIIKLRAKSPQSESNASQ